MRIDKYPLSILALIATPIIFFNCKSYRKEVAEADYSSWRTYAGSRDGIRYSSNDQITTKNVSQLPVAWTYSSNDKDTGNRSQNQCNPVMVDGILYGTTASVKVFALKAATGRQLWLF